MRRLSRVPSFAALSLVACGAINNTTQTTGDTDSATGSTSSDPTMGDPTDGGGLKDVTIYDIQQEKVAQSTLVRVKDVVVVSPTSFAKSGAASVFVQEADGGEYSAIQLYIYADTATELMNQGKVPKPGDKITVIGTYVEYKAAEATLPETYSEINVSLPDDLTITGSATIPPPPVVNPADIATGGPKTENWESVPVTVEDVDVTNPDLGFGEYEVTGGLRIDDFFVKTPLPAPGATGLTLTGPLMYAFDNFKLAPRTCDDIVGTPCDMVDTTTDTTTGPMTTTTIYEIQQGMVDPMTVVTIENVIVTTPLTFKNDGFFVQDPMGGQYSGIQIYVGANNPAMIAVKPGDVVTITGLYNEFYDMSQITATKEGDITVTGTDTVPDPLIVLPADLVTEPDAEAYEGVLVTVENVTVATEADQFGEWIVDDGLHVDDLFFAAADWPKPSAGDTFASITGAMAFSFENRKLSPRTADDLVP